MDTKMHSYEDWLLSHGFEKLSDGSWIYNSKEVNFCNNGETNPSARLTLNFNDFEGWSVAFYADVHNAKLILKEEGFFSPEQAVNSVFNTISIVNGDAQELKEKIWYL
jgi:hypothetical protein